jgi:CheY-like chemotaxis protein
MKDNKKIMVVDDNEEVITMVKTALEREGYRVIGVKNGDECLERVNEEKPDLILMDIMMPGVDGWEVCKKIKESELIISVPISMLTVKRADEDIQKSLEYAHADGHLIKPFSVKEFRNAVQDLLEDHKGPRS